MMSGLIGSLIFAAALFCAAQLGAADYTLGPCLVVSGRTCPDNVYVHFFLYTRENPTVGELLDVNNITASRLDPTRPTKILIHGYSSNMNGVHYTAMRSGLSTDYLDTVDVNVIMVDWSVLARGPQFICYQAAQFNSRHVGLCLAQLVQRLRAVNATGMHVVGMSMGAHIAGFAANALHPYLLPRITGLDPAKPWYETANLDHKLDAADAAFVDVIHTNGLFMGKIEQTGHVDFYVNGGVRQPGCSMFDVSTFCNHYRALELFTETIRPGKGFWGWNCAELRAAMMDQCPATSPAILMGEHVSTAARGIVRVNTANQAPYALGPWVMPVPVHDPLPSRPWLTSSGFTDTWPVPGYRRPWYGLPSRLRLPWDFVQDPVFL